MRSVLFLAGLAVSLVASSQEIYRWVDKNGIVHYSDQPGAANAELISVIEPNAYDTADTAIATSVGTDPDTEPPEEIPPYESLTITSPQQDQVFFGADSVVPVQAELGGTLRPDHQLVFFVNGNRREAPGQSLELSSLDRGTYFLRASVLDQSGQPIISSPQTTFHVRQPSILSPQSPQAPPRPQLPSKPTPKPTPKPPPKPPTG